MADNERNGKLTAEKEKEKEEEEVYVHRKYEEFKHLNREREAAERYEADQRKIAADEEFIRNWKEARERKIRSGHLEGLYGRKRLE